MKSSRAFTLIELLIVIAILGILMALLFPAVDSALQAAKKAQAKNDVVQIATAITAYETEYGRLPDTNDTGVDVGGAVLSALMGTNTTLNPRQIVFIEVQNAKRGKSGVTNQNFVDPWGGAYQICYDGDYDNRISKAGTNGSTSIMKKVAVWNNPGVHSDSASPVKKAKRYVTSWGE